MAGPELASWKEIAAHLGCSVRTVQRWERERGLPIRRIPGDHGTVYAVRSEIDSWKHSPAGRELVSSAVASERQVNRFRGWALMLAIAAAGVVALITNRQVFEAGETAVPAAPGLVMGGTTGSSGGLDDGVWPTVAASNQRTHFAPVAGPAAPVRARLMAEAPPPTAIEFAHHLEPPIVDSRGRLIFGGCGFIQSLSTTGQPLWNHNFPRSSYTERVAGLAVMRDGAVFVGTGDCPNDIHTHRVNVYAIGAGGTPVWAQLQGASRAPVVLANGVVFADEFNTVRMYNGAGALQWTTDLAGYSGGAPVLGPDGHLYFSTDGSLYHQRSLWSLTLEGEIRWSVGAGTLMTPLAAPDGTLFVPAAPSTVRAYRPDGGEAWSLQVPEFTGHSPLSRGPSGTIYLRAKQSLIAVSPQGRSLWTFEARAATRALGGAAVDRDENLYVSFGDAVYSVDRNGRERWRFGVPSAGDLILGGDGLLFVVANGTRILAIETVPIT